MASRTGTPFAIDPASRPQNVGIVGMDIYFPSLYVRQAELEKFDGVSEGKYTIGLAQEAMAVCSEQEDINSVCLTAVANFLEKYNINPRDIGRLEVGTETMVDKSKAVKTTLMQLFQECGNTDIEGVDSKNACYGGTAALLNSQAWVESTGWDGRYALVVAGDIAVYERGPARPTGGAGIVVMLVGPDAPILLEPWRRSTHMEDVYDFYKPTMVSEYPRVDGHLSNACYLRALDQCYNGYVRKSEALEGRTVTMTDSNYAIFHAPYNKLVQKSFGRLLWQDFLRNPDSVDPAVQEVLAPFTRLSTEETYTDRDLAKTLTSISKPMYKEMVAPTELLTKQCGNMYCGSLYAGLLSLVHNKADEAPFKRALMFSYGSGLAATMFSVRFRDDITHIRNTADIQARLDARTEVDPQTFTEILDAREKSYTNYNYTPEAKFPMFPGTFALASVDELERRTYTRYAVAGAHAHKPMSTMSVNARAFVRAFRTLARR